MHPDNGPTSGPTPEEGRAFPRSGSSRRGPERSSQPGMESTSETPSTPASAPRFLRPPAGLRWRFTAPGAIVVIDPSTPRVHHLQGLESLVWEWLSEGASHGQLIRRLRSVLSLAADVAESRLRSVLEGWHSRGLLEADFPQPSERPAPA